MIFFRWIRRGIKKAFNLGKNIPPIIVPYLTYGTKREVYLHGRVMEDKKIRPSKDDHLVDIIKNTYKRFQTDELPNQFVVAEVQGRTFKTVTDQEGYFRIHKGIKSFTLIEKQTNWLEVNYHLQDNSEIKHVTKLMIPHKAVDFGIISDIDDTVLHTEVTSFLKLKVLYNSLLKSATEREPLRGASPFYQALQRGPNRNNHNPFFYISNSPWNLYNYLRIFLREKEFPEGPVLLRDFAMPWQANYRNEKNHKQREIRNIFLTYPKMKFILFGDSAEHDATIYSGVAKEFPDQVLCVYLHTVKKQRQMVKIQKIVADAKHVQMVLVNNALQAAEHALSNNYISETDFLQLKKELES